MRTQSLFAAGLAMAVLTSSLPALASDDAEGTSSSSSSVSSTVGSSSSSKGKRGERGERGQRPFFGNSSRSGAGQAVDIACVQAAVNTRETSLMTGLSTFNTAMTSAYSARKTALNTAWGTTDATQRQTAVKAAWEAFKSAKKAGVKGWNDTRKSAWKTFRTAVKSCKGATAETVTEIVGETVDQ